MKLKRLLHKIYRDKIPARFEDLEIIAIHCDSRQVENNSLFVALPGHQCDGSDFIPDAIKKGAAVIVHNRPSYEGQDHNDICFLKVTDLSLFWKKIIQRFYGDPSQKVKTIGVTGTNGKTTITYLLESIIKESGKNCGVIGTVNYRLGKKVMIAKNTTPGLLDNQRHLAYLAEEGIEYCAMEVSSHALEQGRVGLIDFAAAIFSNLTGDHLDYHKDMECYFKAKSLLFTQLSGDAVAVINVDDHYGLRLKRLMKSKTITYGLKSLSDVTAEDIRLTLSGSTFTLKWPQGKTKIVTPLIGLHNVYNILAAASACLSQGFDTNAIKKGIERLYAVPGRLEQLRCGQDFYVFVDYTHTEDALKNVLTSLRRASDSKIILVFGCGGNRDKTKRPKMGKLAGELADWTILTSDNPRQEDPQAIVEDIKFGFGHNNYQVILDRKAAIKQSLTLANRGDIVLIAGKGHENYQIFKDRTIPFDDREVVKEIFGENLSYGTKARNDGQSL